MIGYLLAFFFFILFLVFFYISYKSMRLNRMYEEFYESTHEDLSIIFQTISSIIDRRPLLVDDPDVQKMVEGLRIAQQIIFQYSTLNLNKEGQEN